MCCGESDLIGDVVDIGIGSAAMNPYWRGIKRVACSKVRGVFETLQDVVERQPPVGHPLAEGMLGVGDAVGVSP